MTVGHVALGAREVIPWALVRGRPGPMLPAYAIPSILAATALVALAGATLARRHELAHGSFALLCLVWAVFAVAAARLPLLDDRVGELCWSSVCAPDAPALTAPVATAVARWARVPAALAFVVGFFAMLHVLSLTGRDGRLDERLGPVRVRHYVVVFAGLTLGGALLTLGTGLVVAGAAYRPGVGVGVRLAPAAPLVLVPYGLATLVWVVLLRRARREAAGRATRDLLANALLGLGALQVGAFVVTLALPALGVPVPGLALDAAVLVAILLSVGLARYRRASLEERLGEAERRLAAGTDDLRRAQARLAEAERLASLGALVAEIADDMTGPLGAVRTMHDTRSRAANRLVQRLQSLLGDAAPSDRTLVHSREVLEQGEQVIREGLDRMDRVIGHLRGLAKLDQAELTGVDLNVELDQTLALMTTRMARIRVVRRYGDVPSITCVARQIRHVLFGVLANAVEAIDGGEAGRGTITVTTAHQGEKVAIQIADDGPGISAQHLPRVFDAGFTTKVASGGLGLGLAICSHVVHEHGGEIGLESAPGVGTTLTILLPIEARLIVRSVAAPPPGSESAPTIPPTRPQPR